MGHNQKHVFRSCELHKTQPEQWRLVESERTLYVLCGKFVHRLERVSGDASTIETDQRPCDSRMYLLPRRIVIGQNKGRAERSVAMYQLAKRTLKYVGIKVAP
jgi:hypothetical protein